MPESWFVVRCKPSREIVAAASIASKGPWYSTFLPIIMVERSHAGKRERVSRPLFPRYLFVKFDKSDNTIDYGELNYCRGVASRGLMVNIDNKPISIPDAIISEIRNREICMNEKTGIIATGWVAGDKFKLQIGRYADFEATYMGEENGKAWVTIEMFKQPCLVEVPLEAVPPCKKIIDRLAG